MKDSEYMIGIETTFINIFFLVVFVYSVKSILNANYGWIKLILSIFLLVILILVYIMVNLSSYHLVKSIRKYNDIGIRLEESKRINKMIKETFASRKKK